MACDRGSEPKQGWRGVCVEANPITECWHTLIRVKKKSAGEGEAVVTRDYTNRLNKHVYKPLCNIFLKTEEVF